MSPTDLPDTITEIISRAPGCTVTLDARAIEHFMIALDPAVAPLTARPPAPAIGIFSDGLVNHTIRLDRTARGGRALFLDGSVVAREWFKANFGPGDKLEVRILGPVQFWLGRV